MGLSDHTTPQNVTNKMPYFLAFRFEVVIPLEVGWPIIGTEAHNVGHNEKVLAWDLNLTEERRENALI